MLAPKAIGLRPRGVRQVSTSQREPLGRRDRVTFVALGRHRRTRSAPPQSSADRSPHPHSRRRFCRTPRAYLPRPRGRANEQLCGTYVFARERCLVRQPPPPPRGSCPRAAIPSRTNFGLPVRNHTDAADPQILASGCRVLARRHLLSPPYICCLRLRSCSRYSQLSGAII
jgi:hypothetical protein